jgi:hypothetical protein
MAKQQQNTEEFKINRQESGIKNIPQAEDNLTQQPNRFLEESPLPMQPDNMGGDDIVFDINQEVLRKIELESKKQLQPNPINQIKTVDNSIQEIIKPIVKVVDTPKIITNNKEISQIDRTSTDTVAKIVSSPKQNIVQLPITIDINTLSAADQRRLASEEDKRRKLDDERRADIEQAFNEEQIRRNLFDSEISIMKAEFEQYLKDKYPEFDKDNIQNRDVITDPPSPEQLQQREQEKLQRQQERQRLKSEQSNQKIELQKQKIQRLEREKERKSQENEFQINQLRRSEIQIFLEEDVLIEQKEKLARNPEIEGLNEVQIKLKEIEQYEQRLGRPIIPHRDIVETEESDLDPKAYTTSNDDLIIIPNDVDVVRDTDKLNKLLELRRDLGDIEN